MKTTKQGENTINNADDSYLSPQIQIILVTLERGFASSTEPLEDGGEWA